jgi:WD40 repeat protein
MTAAKRVVLTFLVPSSFQTMQCHTKQTSDFVFQGGASSLFCTAGQSSDGRNVGLWDTLMPHKRCNVQSFTFHESGASAIVHAPQHQQLVTAGKRGLVAVWDLRQQKQVHFFKAHDQAVKCVAIDPNEEFFVTGSVAGDIKVRDSDDVGQIGAAQAAQLQKKYPNRCDGASPVSIHGFGLRFRGEGGSASRGGGGVGV